LQERGFLDYTQKNKESIWKFDDVMNQA